MVYPARLCSGYLHGHSRSTSSVATTQSNNSLEDLATATCKNNHQYREKLFQSDTRVLCILRDPSWVAWVRTSSTHHPETFPVPANCWRLGISNRPEYPGCAVSWSGTTGCRPAPCMPWASDCPSCMAADCTTPRCRRGTRCPWSSGAIRATAQPLARSAGCSRSRAGAPNTSRLSDCTRGRCPPPATRRWPCRCTL